MLTFTILHFKNYFVRYIHVIRYILTKVKKQINYFANFIIFFYLVFMKFERNLLFIDI